MPFSNYLREGTSEGFTTLSFNRFGGLPEGLGGAAGARGRFLVDLINIGRGSCFFGIFNTRFALGFASGFTRLLTTSSVFNFRFLGITNSSSETSPSSDWSNHDWNLSVLLRDTRY